jgi:hypothetical protein
MTEYVIDENRRIDIAVEDGKVFVPIEVKIEAGDQPKQIADYFAFARTKNRNSHIPVLYLTVDGHEPSDFSKGGVGKDGYVPLSFRDDILAWLDACARENENTPETTIPVRENLRQLIAAVKSLCGKSEDTEMDDAIFKLITKDDESVRAALAVSKNVDFGKAAWEAFKGPIYKMVQAAWPQGNVDCIPKEGGWYYLWLDFNDEKFGLYVNYLWDQVELKTEDGSDANSPEGKALYEKMSAEFARRPAPPHANIVWLSRGLWWPEFDNDELYLFHLYKLYTERPQEVADRIVSIAQALESVKA